MPTNTDSLESPKCPRCKSDDKKERRYVQPFPGFANDLCQHPWHGRTTNSVQAIIQHGNDTQ